MYCFCHLIGDDSDIQTENGQTSKYAKKKKNKQKPIFLEGKKSLFHPFY